MAQGRSILRSQYPRQLIGGQKATYSEQLLLQVVS